mmetsp:Transcript_7275/g.17732  ORF Transcript_7275/g.17732 Transcript_7275/m.17732 type:complete len:103 (+) Transcript_7275:688-996(+)
MISRKHSTLVSSMPKVLKVWSCLVETLTPKKQEHVMKKSSQKARTSPPIVDIKFFEEKKKENCERFLVVFFGLYAASNKSYAFALLCTISHYFENFKAFEKN